MAVNINEFFSALSQDQNYFLHFPFLWSVTIDGVTEGAINGVLSDAGELWSARTSPNMFTKSGSILVAQEISLPNEASSFTALESGGAMGGYLPGYALNTRTNFLDRTFSVNFLETETGISHDFFRPWMIAIGIKGLVETGSTLKGNMEVHQYTNEGVMMRGFKFKRVFPTAVEAYTLNYSDTEFKINSVTFACTNYEQL